MSRHRSSPRGGINLLQEIGLVVQVLYDPDSYWRSFTDHATLNAPTSLNLGVVYPQALLIWTIGITYSIITPLILPFAMLYFGLAYFVYKYRFLFVFCEWFDLRRRLQIDGADSDPQYLRTDRPYESRGQAWPLAYNRVGLGLLIFQVFMLGAFRTLLFENDGN